MQLYSNLTASTKCIQIEIMLSNDGQIFYKYILKLQGTQIVNQPAYLHTHVHLAFFRAIRGELSSYEKTRF